MWREYKFIHLGNFIQAEIPTTKPYPFSMSDSTTVPYVSNKSCSFVFDVDLEILPMNIFVVAPALQFKKWKLDKLSKRDYEIYVNNEWTKILATSMQPLNVLGLPVSTSMKKSKNKQQLELNFMYPK